MKITIPTPIDNKEAFQRFAKNFLHYALSFMLFFFAGMKYGTTFGVILFCVAWLPVFVVVDFEPK